MMVTGIHSAAAKGDLAMIKNILSRHRSRAKAEDEDGRGENHLRLVNGPNRFGYSPLHTACYHERLAADEYLLRMGADARLETRGNPWTTALHVAALRGNCAIIECLLGAGADPSRADSGGLCPMQLAQQCSHKQAAQILREAS